MISFSFYCETVKENSERTDYTRLAMRALDSFIASSITLGGREFMMNLPPTQRENGEIITVSYDALRDRKILSEIIRACE